MRTYTFLASRPGGCMNWPGQEVDSSLRIRPLVVMVFRKWFGRNPTFHFGFDGWFGEAYDERGNCIKIDQHNHDLTDQWHTLDRRLFTLFSWRDGRLTPYIPPSHQIADRKEAA